MRLISRWCLIFCVRFRRLKLCIRLHEYFGVQLEWEGKHFKKKARPLFWKVKELALELYLGTIAIGCPELC